MRSDEIFVKLTLSNGDHVEVMKLTGGHLFAAMFMCNPQNINQLSFYVLCEAMLVNSKSPTIEYLKDLDLEDVQVLMETINAQMTKVRF